MSGNFGSVLLDIVGLFGCLVGLYGRLNGIEEFDA
jgi:hypothetical protein